MAKVYLETSFVSYLAAWPSRDLIMAGHQQITHEWWRTRRSEHELYVSRVVIDEARSGDEDASRSRTEIVEGIPVLQLNQATTDLAKALVSHGAFPKTAAEDALHVALATVHGMDFLLTWNCRHIANAETGLVMAEVCAMEGYEMPKICTPEELMGRGE